MFDTSAACALTARLAAQLAARYPNFAPETLRGLLVHSARWSPAMRQQAIDEDGVLDTSRLLRLFGYGKPDEQALFASANNHLTLIAQDVIQPFFKDFESGAIKTNELKLHTLPWPADALRQLPLTADVDLRITLSYFVEPSPGERGWDKKYGYASHGLRFAVCRAAETPREFVARINKLAQAPDHISDDRVDETGRWALPASYPANSPSSGSIHSNIWRGPAADLANRHFIAVYPTNGWWRTRPGEGRFNNIAAYSLIVSISTPLQNVDIYTPVAIQIGVPITIEP